MRFLFCFLLFCFVVLFLFLFCFDLFVCLFVFNFTDIKTSMCNLFINGIGIYTPRNNYIGRGRIVFDIKESEINSNI